MTPAASPSDQVPWELQLFDGIRNGPIVLNRACTPDQALELTGKIEKLLRDHLWLIGEGAHYEADEIYLEVIRLVGTEFETEGDVTFLMVNPHSGQVWHVKDGVFTPAEVPS